ncbi:uncharacterized protein MCYG_00969 [Microsporum canis CBS 113480]|uniref:Uncharacterized protein n=1 Tax=Arthroderma otae (strain ATCC MYA-4605 / CBS 113480) TaxID=554155 RepID=C5FE47_ARTOC|nr:uncharacterized protein MCYG_00969 [Microsporum canis CBS 113480]EEQ28081.1 predicted protein [Microsporum canis CBS 113480]
MRMQHPATPSEAYGRTKRCLATGKQTDLAFPWLVFKRLLLSVSSRAGAARRLMGGIGRDEPKGCARASKKPAERRKGWKMEKEKKISVVANSIPSVYKINAKRKETQERKSHFLRGQRKKTTGMLKVWERRFDIVGDQVRRLMYREEAGRIGIKQVDKGGWTV